MEPNWSLSRSLRRPRKGLLEAVEEEHPLRTDRKWAPVVLVVAAVAERMNRWRDRSAEQEEPDRCHRTDRKWVPVPAEGV